MITPELIQYVKSEVAKGTTREIISNKIKMQGWTDLDISDVFDVVNQPSSELINSSINSNKNTVLDPVVNQTINTIANPIPVINIMPMNSPVNIETKSNKHFIKYFVILLVIIILLSGVALAYASGFFLSTSKLFLKITNSSKMNKMVKLDMSLNIDASEMKIPENSISDNIKVANFNMSGFFDMTDTSKPKFDSSYVFKMGKIDAGVSIRSIDGSLYLNLTKGPNLGFFSLAPFENRWVSIPITNKDGKLDTANPVLSTPSINSNFINNLTDEQKQHIKDIVKKASIIKITKKHLPEIVDGALSYHISYDLNKVGLASFFTELTTYMKSLDKNDGAFKDVSSSDINKLINSITSFNGELWIGIFDNLPHKIIINTTIINSEKPEDGNVKIFATLIYKDWNKSVIVEVPSNVVTVEELTKEIFGGMVKENSLSNQSGENTTDGIKMFSEQKLTQDDKIKINIINLMKSTAEVYNNSSIGKLKYKGFCTDKGSNGAYKLAITLPKGSVYKCNDSDTTWAAWIKLSTNEYFCVDNYKISNNFVNLPSGTSCPKQ